MTLSEFENGYWYATELQDFGKRIGIPSAKKLRKDELERAIKSFLVTGTARNPTKRKLSVSGMRDSERGLSLKLDVVRFTNDPATKAFLDQEARKCIPGFSRRSGVRYRFNRWREEQLARGARLTYGDLVEEYIRLNQIDRLDRVPYACYVNFLSDFFAAEENATRGQAIRAWKKLKSLDAPKTYEAWVLLRGVA
jgi:hypothetical protein